MELFVLDLIRKVVIGMLGAIFTTFAVNNGALDHKVFGFPTAQLYTDFLANLKFWNCHVLPLVSGLQVSSVYFKSLPLGT